MSIEVAELNTYPVKGCAAVNLETTELAPRGLPYDREWMVARQSGQMLTQRTHAQLALVQTGFEDGQLIITAPGTGQIEVPLDKAETANNERLEVEVFKKRGIAIDQGKEAGAFFSDFLQDPKLKQGVRLLRIDQPRQVKPLFRVDGVVKDMGFADGFPLLITSESSLADLNGHLARPIGNDRFRPNIVVRGTDLDAYEEDYWREIRIGNLRVFILRACMRCPVPNVDQEVGILPKQAEREVSKALEKTRHGIETVKEDDGSISIKEGEFFGQNAGQVFEEGVTVSISDKVSVLQRRKNRNFELVSERSLSGSVPRPRHPQHHPASELL